MNLLTTMIASVSAAALIAPGRPLSRRTTIVATAIAVNGGCNGCGKYRRRSPPNREIRGV